MARVGADCIGKIRVAANASGNPDAIYATAQLPPPATPSPVPPPGTASDFEVELRQDGALMLTWKCSNPKRGSGTTYMIDRRLGSGAWTPLGVAGPREITDATVPAGTAQITYKITAVRSTAMGNPAFFTVNLGVGASGEMTAAVAGGRPTTTSREDATANGPADGHCRRRRPSSPTSSMSARTGRTWRSGRSIGHSSRSRTRPGWPVQPAGRSCRRA